MSPQKPSLSNQIPKLTAVVGVLVLLFVIISGSRITLSKNSHETSQKQIETVPPGQEKKLGLVVPGHVPLKVKVKNVNSKRWVHDLEVAVTNASDRPIYFLSFSLSVPEIRGASGYKVGFWLHYGRAELLEFQAPLRDDDVALQPGETYTFKIPEGNAKAWDFAKEKQGRPEPKIIKLFFQQLNFGDGTGFQGSGGTYINIHRKVRASLLDLLSTFVYQARIR